MKYNKPPKSTDEQIELLTARGMKMPPNAEHLLSHTSYCRLSTYWKRLLLDETVPKGKFKEKTGFDQVIYCYQFDQKLRLLILEAIQLIEISIRTQWAYHLVMYNGKYNAHLCADLFKKSAEYKDCIAILNVEVERSNEEFIRHFLEKYPNSPLPIWMAVEIMSLGLLSNYYKNTKNFLCIKISATYDMKHKTLGSFLHKLTTIRNRCAHHSRLWNRKFSKEKIPDKEIDPAYFSYNTDNEGARKIYNLLFPIINVLNIINPDNDWQQRLLSLLGENEDFAREMGFPDGWREMEFWNPK